MILVLALALGLLLGLGWAGWHQQTYQIPALRSAWLALIAFLPQLIIAYLPSTRHILPNWLASTLFLASLFLFLTFAWINRHLPGMPILIVGLLLNLVVILANGGWMPIGPQTANRLAGRDVSELVSLGSRFGQKDILLLPQNTHLEFLADRFLPPAWFPYQVAFSLGDIFIGSGVFWLLAYPSTKAKIPSKERVHLDYI